MQRYLLFSLPMNKWLQNDTIAHITIQYCASSGYSQHYIKLHCGFIIRARGTRGALLNILVFNTDSFVYIQIHLLFRALHRT